MATTSTHPTTPSSLTTTPTASAHPHPTPSYRIAMTSGGGTTAGSTLAPQKSHDRPRNSVVSTLPEGLLGPPAQRPTRLSLPAKVQEPVAQNTRAGLPPPPPSPALRRRAALIFYAIVGQFFLSIACLFWAVATIITLFSFGLGCSFGLDTVAVLAFVAFCFSVVVAQLITSSVGIAAFNGKQQVETKIYLLIVYLAVNLVEIFIDAGLLAICVAGGALSFTYEKDCAQQIRIREYIALGSFFVFFGATVLLHLIASFVIFLLLCWTSELFIQRGPLINAGVITTCTTTTVKEEHLSAPAPPIKRFSQV